MGAYPVEAVAAMAKIAIQAEQDDPKFLPSGNMWFEMDSSDTTNAVGHAACTLARDINAKAIMSITKSGYTALRMSKFRPNTLLLAATPHEKTYHQLALVWGVYPLMVENLQNVDVLVYRCLEEGKSAGLITKGDKVVISAGVPLDVTGKTNMIRVEFA